MSHDIDPNDPYVRWFRFILAHRVAVLVVVAVLSVASVGLLTRVTVGSTLQKLFFGDSPDYASYLESSQRFGNDEHVLLGFSVDDPLAPELLAQLSALDAAVGAIPGLLRADSVATLQRVAGTDGNLTVMPWGEGATVDDALADPGVGGVFVGTDRHSVAVLVELAVDPDRTAEQGLQDIQLLDDQVNAVGLGALEVHRAGFPVLLVEMLHLAWDNLYFLLPLSMVCLLVVVMAVFRRLMPALVSVGIAGIAMLWTMALSSLVDPVFSIMVTAVPLVVVVVGFSDVIHLWSAWEQERRLGRDNEAAILASASDVGRACMLTSVTTFVGFVSLVFVPTPMFQQMGLTLGTGVALALLLAMTVVPVLLSFGLDNPADTAAEPLPPGRWRTAVAHLDRRLDDIVDMCAHLSITFPRSVTAVFLALMVVALAGASQMNVDADLVRRVDDSHRLQVDARWLGERFVSDDVVQVFVDASSPDALLEPNTLVALAAFQDEVERLPGIAQAASIVDALRLLHEKVGGGDGRSLPATREAVAQELLLFEMSGGEDLDRLLDFERQRARMVVRVDHAGMRATREKAVAIESLAQQMLPNTVRVEATGLSSLMGAWIDRIVAGQEQGVGFSVGIVALLMALGLRSWRLGLVSMVPNLLPLVWLGGVLGVAWVDVDTDTAIIAMLAIGIGVDDTIHFLMRYRAEAGRSPDRRVAIRRTFDFAGRAILMTTVVLVVGFLPCALSDYYSLWILGTLLPMVLVFAVLADLLMVPAMVQLGWLAVARRAGAASP